MHIDPYIVLGSAVVGFPVGMTGAGGGALMTPMLILLFGVTPSAAISSDLVAAVVTSVGSDSLMIILLLFLYPMLGTNPMLGANQLVAELRRGRREAPAPGHRAAARLARVAWTS
jgi:hypothetical protein